MVISYLTQDKGFIGQDLKESAFQGIRQIITAQQNSAFKDGRYGMNGGGVFKTG